MPYTLSPSLCSHTSRHLFSRHNRELHSLRKFADCLTTQQGRDALITLVGIHTSATDVGVLIPGRNASLGRANNQCQRNQGFNSLHATHSELGITYYCTCNGHCLTTCISTAALYTGRSSNCTCIYMHAC